MAGKGFIDIGVRSQFNRSARGNIQDSEASNETRQSVIRTFNAAIGKPKHPPSRTER